MIKNKLNAWCHSKETHYNPEYLSSDKYVSELIDSGKDLFGRGLKFVTINDESLLPSYMVKNKDRFSHLIKE